MKIEEKYRLLGEAIMRDYFTHGEKEIVVTITDAGILDNTHVSVDIHPVISFREREMQVMRHL